MIAASYSSADAAAETGLAVLFVAAGPQAQEALRQLQEVAKELRAAVAGRFGFLHLGPLHAAPHVAGLPSLAEGQQALRTWVAERIPAKLPPRGAQGEPVDLRTATIRLVRSLTLLQPQPAFQPAALASLSVYVVADLCDAVQLDRAVEAVRQICRETFQVDITWVLLTGRSARFEADQEHAWRAGYCRLNEAVLADATHDRCLLHRVYFCDGQDSRTRWLGTPQAGARKAAEFLFHHALASYRWELRKFEASRPSPLTPLWPVLGSFVCHSLVSDQAAIAQETAREILRRSAAAAAPAQLTEADRRLVDQTVKALAGRLQAILIRDQAAATEEPPAALPSGAAETGAADGATTATVAQQVRAAVHQAICELCRDGEPLGRLKYFGTQLRAELHAIRMSANVAERRLERFRVAQLLRTQLSLSQLDSQRWLPPGARAAATQETPSRTLQERARPRGEHRPAAARRAAAPSAPRRWVLERPLPFWRIAVGIGLAVAGLAAFAWLSAGGALTIALVVPWLLVLGGTLTLDLPSEQFPVVETIFAPGETGQAQAHEFRQLPSQTQAAFGAVLALGGAVFVGLQVHWDIAPETWQWAAAAVVALAAIVALLWNRPSSRNQQAPDFEAARYGSDYPSAYPLVAFLGWAGLLAVVAMALHSWGLRIDRPFFPYSPVVGFLAVAAGLVLATYPASLAARFQQHLPKPPLPPLNPIYGQPRRAAALDSSLERVLRWIDGLAVKSPKPPKSNVLAMLSPLPRRTFLDAVVEDWPEKVANLCEETVAAARQNPVSWADCLLSGFEQDELGTRLDQLDEAFTARTVNAWLTEQIERFGWSLLLQNLGPDPHWTARLFEQNLAPLWPHDARDVDVDMGLAVATPELLAGEMSHAVGGNRYRVLAVSWPDPRRVVLVRLVQGMPEDRYADWLASLAAAAH